MHMLDLTLARRGLIAAGGVAAASGLIGAGPASARIQMPAAQAPYFYRFKLGDAQATIVSDGILPLGAPGDAFLGLSKPEIERQLADNFLPTNNIVLEQNILVISIGGKTALFDTGMGGVKPLGRPPES